MPYTFLFQVCLLQKIVSAVSHKVLYQTRCESNRVNLNTNATRKVTVIADKFLTRMQQEKKL